MAIRENKIYSCMYCGREYPDPFKADACRDSHELLYIAMTKEDLNRIINFIYSKEDSLITEALLTNLRRYIKYANVKSSRDTSPTG